jgi:RNA polymerase sigma-70 factor (ECF subfamily)
MMFNRSLSPSSASAVRAELPRAALANEELRQAARPHMGHLHSIALRILGDEDLANDAVQESLLALWRLGEVPARTRAWLVRAVIHRALHARRAVKRRQHWEERAAKHSAPECPLCDPEREVESRELVAELLAAVDTLAPEYREVVALRVDDQLDYQEIAARLRVPVGTVRSRLFRARALLRARLARTDWA